MKRNTREALVQTRFTSLYWYTAVVSIQRRSTGGLYQVLLPIKSQWNQPYEQVLGSTTQQGSRLNSNTLSWLRHQMQRVLDTCTYR